MEEEAIRKALRLSMFCSTIIPTVGRTTLARAVKSVLQQSFEHEDFEVIIVNDSANPLQNEDWQASRRVHLLHTNHRERSVARNSGAAIARGQYLHFLDDDDWILPGALDKFWQLAQTLHPAWMYGGSQLVDRSGNELIQLHHGISGNIFLHTMAGEWIPLQSSLIVNDLFHQIGGFNPFITGPEDIDLLRRIALHSEVVEIDHLVACIEMGDLGSTTDYNQHPEMSRKAREEILDMPGVYSRLCSGAGSGYWFGKLSRIYLTSAVWNIQHKRLFTAFSRLMHAVWSVRNAGKSAVSRSYFSSITRQYLSNTFQKGIQEAQESSPG